MLRRGDVFRLIVRQQFQEPLASSVVEHFVEPAFDWFDFERGHDAPLCGRERDTLSHR